MKNLLAFLLGWLIAAALLIPQAHAAVAVTPLVPGYSAGSYRAAASAFTMTAANDGFVAQAVANIGGRSITLPATMRMAANAGRYAIEGMRLTPWGIVGTLAAGWLLQQGLEYINGQWQKTSGQYCIVWGGVTACGGTAVAAAQAWNAATGGVFYGTPTCNGDANSGNCFYTQPYFSGDLPYNKAGTQTNPATQDDWDALPDPLPAIAPELPYAPYLPNGVPVNSPEYAPADVPLAPPYTKPDGSTAQPRAKISPATDGQVTVSTYDQPITDSSGQPVSNPTPTPTNDPPPDQCEGHPDRFGCVDLGTPPAGEAMPSSTKQITFAPVSIASNPTCPAPITFTAFGKSMQIDYSPACTYASGIKPVVIAVGYLTAAFIIFGIPRSQS